MNNNDDSDQYDIASNTGLQNGCPITFTVTLTNLYALALHDALPILDGTATTGDSDYTAVSNQTLSFAAGVTTQTFTVAPTADSKVEANETFTFSQSGLNNGSRAVATAGNGRAATTNDEDSREACRGRNGGLESGSRNTMKVTQRQ